MDKVKLYQVDAFTSTLFSGNPAAVCPLNTWFEDNLLQQIAMENNLPETAFFVKQGEGYKIRWFTPNKEVDLCGHATLAAAHIIFNYTGSTGHRITFDSKSGPLIVTKTQDDLEMDFPADNIKLTDPPNFLIQGLNIPYPREVFEGVSDLMVVLNSEKEVLTIKPDFRLLASIDKRGIIVTAPGDHSDFMSRCFYPAYGIDEDPVTGSAHTTMVPYWANRLDKNELKAIQKSKRGGEVNCVFNGDRVSLIGKAVTYLEGEIILPGS